MAYHRFKRYNESYESVLLDTFTEDNLKKNEEKVLQFFESHRHEK